MKITDIYELKESKSFYLSPSQQKKIDLKLDKICASKTMLTGIVKYRNIPIKNAAVQVFNNNCKPLYHTYTNKSGIYSFTNILSPGKYEVIAAKNCFLTSHIKQIKIYSNSIHRLDFRLYKNPITNKALLYGTVYNKCNNKRISNAIIKLRDTRNPKKIIAKTVTNKSGQYLIYNLPSKDFIISVSHPKYIPITLYKHINNIRKIDFKLTKTIPLRKFTLNQPVKPYDDEIIFYEIKCKYRKEVKR